MLIKLSRLDCDLLPFVRFLIYCLLQLWDLLEGKSLFSELGKTVKDDTLHYDEQMHLAHIEGLLGPPPADLLIRGQRTHVTYVLPAEWCVSQVR